MPQQFHLYANGSPVMPNIPADFVCEYARRPGQKCDACDCFVDLYPDSPFDLHPEAFLVGGHSRMIDGTHAEDCPGCKT